MLRTKVLNPLPEGDVPDHLREDVEHGDEHVCDGQVVHERVHSGGGLSAQLPGQGHQHQPVARQRQEEDRR